MSLQSRRRATGRGRVGERLATCLLRLKGYRILARDMRGPLGEIDIIARRRRTIVFVEVKARADIDSALAAVTANQRGRIERAAAGFLAAHPRYADDMVRFDLIAVAPGRWPRHIVDAWRP